MDVRQSIEACLSGRKKDNSMRLSAKDLDALQRAILALHKCSDIEDFVRGLPGIILRLIPADYFYLFQFDFSRNRTHPKLVATIDPSKLINREVARFAEQRLLDHPFPRYFAQTGDRTALKMTDFLTMRQFRGTEAYERFYRHLGIEQQLAVPAVFGAGKVGGLSLGNRGREFRERDRLLLNLLRPHIELAHRNIARWSALKAQCLTKASASGLTPRESEVALWLKAGKTNPEIAAILGTKVRTVEKHMESILAKLGVENRTTAAVILVRAGKAENIEATIRNTERQRRPSSPSGSAPGRRH